MPATIGAVADALQQTGSPRWPAGLSGPTTHERRHCAGLQVGTAIIEATTNLLVNCRMNKSQQMR